MLGTSGASISEIPEDDIPWTVIARELGGVRQPKDYMRHWAVLKYYLAAAWRDETAARGGSASDGPNPSSADAAKSARKVHCTSCPIPSLPSHFLPFLSYLLTFLNLSLRLISLASFSLHTGYTTLTPPTTISDCSPRCCIYWLVSSLYLPLSPSFPLCLSLSLFPLIASLATSPQLS